MKQALKALIHEMEYVLSCINADKVPFDGDDFHEALRLGKEALAQPEQKKQFAKVFAQLKSNEEPCSEVLALGQMMREWLQHQVSDNGSCVDTGKGFSEYDLWVMCEGKELFITIKEKRPTK